LTKILFLEDDLLFGETLIDLLEESDYEVEHFTNGQDALNATFDTKYDLYLLDINVPLIDGISLLSDLRKADDTTPAIFLTSHKDKAMLEKGFLSGADDFIKKPFDNDELLWRLGALLKRTQALIPTVVGKLTHDIEHMSISYDGVLLELSKKEYDFLSLLMQHANENLPKELILDSLWRSGEGGSYGAIRVYVNRIKTLLPDLQIENIRGIGYKLVC
jgi:DNA-binding response OmpR family regulator